MSKSAHRIPAPWFKAPLALAFDEELTLADVRVYAAIDYRAGPRGYWWGTHQAISDETCPHTDATRATCPGHEPTVAQRSIERCVRRLETRGYIGTTRLGLQYQNATMYFVLARTIDGPDGPDRDEGLDLTDWPATSTLERAARTARASAIEHRAGRTPAQSHPARQRSRTAPASAVLDQPQTSTTDHSHRPQENVDLRLAPLAQPLASSDQVHAGGFVPTPVTAVVRREQQVEAAVLRACEESRYAGMPIHADDVRNVVYRVRARISRQIEPDEVVAAVNRLREREAMPA